MKEDCGVCGARLFDAEAKELRSALANLVDRLDQIHEHPDYKGVWTSYMIHGGRYEGPTYVEAMAHARIALELTK